MFSYFSTRIFSFCKYFDKHSYPERIVENFPCVSYNKRPQKRDPESCNICSCLSSLLHPSVLRPSFPFYLCVRYPLMLLPVILFSFPSLHFYVLFSTFSGAWPLPCTDSNFRSSVEFVRVVFFISYKIVYCTDMCYATVMLCIHTFSFTDLRQVNSTDV